MVKAYSWRVTLCGPMRRRLLMSAAGLMLYGCAVGPDSSAGGGSPGQRQGPAEAKHAAETAAPMGGPGGVVMVPSSSGQPVVATPVDARPAAMVNGRAVEWGELRPLLAEAAGAEALRDVILDRRLDEALSAAGVVIEPDDLAGERKLMLERLHDDPNQAIRLLGELRERQRLGTQRFERMLRRNAGLRAMVRGRVEVSAAALARQYEAVHGPKRQVRMVVVSALSAAEEVVRLAREGEFFGDLAVRMSLDASAARGGLLEPISAADASYPKVLRDAAFALAAPGDLSNPILLDGQFAVIQLVREVPPSGVSFLHVRGELERVVRLTQEQALMDQLARQLTADVTVTIFDESINESWSAANRQQR